jgi:hypothetical protein
MSSQAISRPSPSSQVTIPKTAAEVPGPVPGNTMTKEYVQMIGRMAYIWGYPMLNAHNRRVASSKAPEQEGGKGETTWVNPAIYYEELPAIMKEVPPLPGEEALYAWIGSVWDAAAKDPATKQALVESFISL